MRTVGPAMVLLALACAGCSREDSEGRRQVKAALDAAFKTKVGRSPDEAALWKDVRRFYEAAAYAPLWIDGTRPRSRWDRLLSALEAADKHGLDAAAYDIDGLRAQRAEAKKKGLLGRQEIDPATVGETDVQLSYTFLKYASHLRQGELDPESVDAEWRARSHKVDLVAALGEAGRTGDVEGTLDGLVPRHPGYKRLEAALESLRRSPAPDAARVRQIELNLDRWRWLPDDLGERHVLVNIPSYDLKLVEHGKPTLVMRVVVGKALGPTPVFSDEITAITFSPRWNVPLKILTDEMIPALKEDGDYLEKHDMEVVKDGQVVSLGDVDMDEPKTFQVRQRPGPSNALGFVKFVLPNEFDVYLHDTPSGALFARTERAFSHGCVRVEKPRELAEALLRDQPKWDRTAIETAMHSGEEQSVKLTQPVPVHIVYWTAWVEEDGTLRFADDVYGHDRTQAAALERSRPRLERQARR
jgi:murein L,D-transpeptidase YcbB/YkuD